MSQDTPGIVALSADDVRRLVPVGELIEDLRRVLAPASLAEFEVPPRHVFSRTAGLIMPCHDNASGVTVTKCLSQNPDRQPAITGTAVWNSPATPDVLVADAIAVTTLRTGAVVGLATDLLAAPDPPTSCSSAQGRSRRTRSARWPPSARSLGSRSSRGASRPQTRSPPC